MTTNQTIDGVPRELVRENIAYLRGMGGTYDQRSALAAKFELLLLDPAPPKELRGQYEAWADANGYDITRNEHGDYAGLVEDSMWTGWQARGELRSLLDAPASDPDCIHCCGGGRDPFGAVCGCAAPKPAAQPQGEPVALKEAYEEGFSDGSRAGDDQYNWEGFRDELAKAWPVSDACKLYAEQPAPVAVRMCDCNQGRMPCNGKCTPTS